MRVATEARSVSPSSLASAGLGRVAVIKGLEPAWAGAYVLGRAFTARGAGADNLALHLAVAHALAGDVIVADVDGDRETAHCGGLLARAAMARGLAGIVLNGAIRDRAAIADLAYPIFHDGTSPRGPAKEVPGELGTFVELSGVVVHTGDLVCADDDGVVVVRAADADSVVHEAKELEARELDIERRIIRGELTVGIFGLAGAE